MARQITYPIMQGATHQHGINLHTSGYRPPELDALINLGVVGNVNRDHHSFLTPRAMAGHVQPSIYVDQMEAVLPPLKLVRPIWNLHSFDRDGKFCDLNPGLWRELAARGWKILLTSFDGPSQRYYYNYHARGPEHVMAGFSRRQQYAWARMLEWFDAEDLLGSIYGYEPQNEPNGYNQLESTGAVSMAKAVWYYTEHCKAVWNIALAANPAPILLFGGWAWAASMMPLETVPIPEYGGQTAIQHLRASYPGKTIVASLHYGPSFWGGSDDTPEPKRAWEFFSYTNQGKWSDWRYNSTHIHLTEVLGIRNNAANAVPVIEHSQGAAVRNMDGHYYFGMSTWWWPFSDFAKAKLVDIYGAPGGVIDFYRHTLTAATAIYAFPNRPEWFKGPQQGLKGPASSDTLHLTQVSPYDRADMEVNWAAAQPLPANSQQLSRYFGGRGTCVIDVADGQFNSVIGGDGWNVMRGGATSWDIFVTGRGGGVVRCGGGINVVQGRWGVLRVYTGPDFNAVFCYTAATTFPQINALNHETTVVIDPAGTHYLYDLHRANHKISFKGVFATPDALRAACSYIPSSKPTLWSHDLMIALPGGGAVRIAYGREVMAVLVERCVDFSAGWYGPGWTEPADYDPAQLTAPIVDPGPAMDALYVWQAGETPFFDRAGNPVEIYDWQGDPAEIVLGSAA